MSDRPAADPSPPDVAVEVDPGELAGSGLDAPDPAEPRDETLADRLRGGGVGTQDPNIVGDAGPTDVAPGTDGDGLLVTTDEDPGHLEV